MKTKDLLIITTTAIATAAGTVAFLIPTSLNADGEATLPPKISPPRFRANGLEFAVTAKDGRLPKAGDPLALELQVRSLTNSPATASIRLVLSASSPADALSRAIRLPTLLWQKQEFMTVAPNETKVLSLSTVTNLPAGKIFSVTLQEVVPGNASDSANTLAGKLNMGLMRPGGGFDVLHSAPGQRCLSALGAGREIEIQIPKAAGNPNVE
jgi:hypothetical protein